MTHLDDIQLVDALESATDLHPHLHDCAACRAKVDELRASLAAVQADGVHEPSPLFWDGFARRVNAGIDERYLSAGGWLPQALAWSGVLALVLAVVSIMVAPKPGSDLRPVRAEHVAHTPIADDIEQDEAWAVVRGLAAELDYDKAREAGVAPSGDSVDRAALELNDAERAELVRIIDEELKRIGP